MALYNGGLKAILSLEEKDLVMGVALGDLVKGRTLELEDLGGKVIGIDAFNALYQFISIIRQKPTGEPLRDSKGRITSHLSGLFYRTINMIEAGIRPVFVFDGKPPEFKRKEIEERIRTREEAEQKWKEAIESGRLEEAFIYAQASARLTDEMAEDAKKLLDYMGIPWIQAPSEGEAQLAVMCRDGMIFASASQDYDSLLFGSTRLVRNLSITGRRKLPRKEVYVEIKPELIELERILSDLGITREQLILIGMLVGTDFNAGVERVGPKKALKLVKEHKDLDELMRKLGWEEEVDLHKVFEFFLDPPSIKVPPLKWKSPNREKLLELMVEEHDFSRERVEKALDKLEKAMERSSQRSLASWV